MDISTVYEDDNLLVINKPYGLIVHPKNATDTQPSVTDWQPSVTDWVLKNYPDLKNIGEPFIASGTPIPRCGIVHRLDKDTSGLLIIAKNQSSFDYLKNLFQTRKIHKYYLALVYGSPKEPKGVINLPLGRVGLKRTTRITGKKLIDKKESVTEYRTIRKYHDFTLLEVMPRTGRTHQIRVHLNSAGTPIAGDPIYGFKKAKLPANLDRLFLHAYKLELTTPDGKRLTLETELPDELEKVLAGLDN